ncbi:MAG: hypothetical protein PHR75_06340 [Sulfurovum sp.]|nr:hypothetical protein [Sulfurovum sp.]MDD3603469.1 hypothetical protein [Sulfurovum sp.]
MRNDFEPKHLRRAKDNLARSLQTYELQTQQNKPMQNEKHEKITFWQWLKSLFIR